MYQALYRKWRPRRFDDVAGQEHITETLKRQVISGKLSHAYLFTGTRGTGKTSCAKILAKAVNCESPENGNPCNKCPSCIGIDNGSIMDVTEMDAASNNGVDNVRALREEAIYLPTSVKKRVYIVDEVHMLSNQAFNALLKILEEPPAHLMFILATTEYHKVPATILSRCQKYSFKRIDPSVIVKNLNYIASQEGLILTEDASQLLARLADGSLRDAHSLLDQCSGKKEIDRQHVLECVGIAEADEICRLFNDIIEGNGLRALERLSGLYTAGKDVSSVLSQLASLHRDILLTKLSPDGGTGLLSGTFTVEDLSGFSRSVSVPRLLTNLETLQTALITLETAVNRKTTAEVCLLRLIDYIPSGEEKSWETGREQPPPKAFAPAGTPSGGISGGREHSRKNEKKHTHEHTDEYNTADTVAAEPEGKPATPQVKNVVEEQIDTANDDGQERSWPELLKRLSTKMDDNLFNILDDSTHSEGKITGNNITISAKSPFSLNQLDDTDVKEAVKAAAESLWGGPFTVSVTQAAPDEAEIKSKLEKLSRFENIRFK
jgi:DNA polymerase-3 subunit gamma/tau